MNAETASAPPARPVAGMAAYVKDHLAVANAMLLAAGFLVALLDFLMPWMKGLAPKIVYSATALPVALTLLASVWPKGAIKVLEGLGFRQATGAVPVWRRPAWRLAAVALMALTMFGAFSIAKAHEGGVMASASESVRSLQAAVAPLLGESREIRAEVDAANSKLDKLISASDDPQKELAARGYPFAYAGVSRALKNADARAVALFAKAGLRIDDPQVMAMMLSRSFAWDQAAVDELRPAMFKGPAACAVEVYFGEPLPEPSMARAEAFKRLCDPAKAIALLEDAGREVSARIRVSKQTDISARDAASAKTLAVNLALLKS